MENTVILNKLTTKRLSKNQRTQAPNLQIGKELTKKLKEIMSTTTYMMIMSIITIYTIFAIDIDKGFFNRNASVYFSSIHTISMLIFCIEIILCSVLEKDYLFHFYFWIDIFSTLMMGLELIWVEDLLASIDNIQVAISFTRISKASRFSKIGARSTKIMKLIRLIKLMKLFKNRQEQIKIQIKEQIPKEQPITQKSKQKSNQQFQQGDRSFLSSQNKFVRKYYDRPNVNQIDQQKIQLQWQQLSQKIKNKQQEKPKDDTGKGTKVGEILKYQIQKNIVLMVMGLITIVPLLSAGTWFNKTADMQPFTQIYINTMNDSFNQTYFSSWFDSYLSTALNSSRPLVQFKYYNYYFSSAKNYTNPSLNIPLYSNLRQSQKVIVDNLTVYSVRYSKKQQIQITSWINITRSFLIIFLLLLASIMFVKDFQIYALGPLQKMSSTVSKIEKNPFSVLRNDEEEGQQMIQSSKNEEELDLQTNILQKFFIKITSFLALGVGQTPLNNSSYVTDKIEQNKNIFEHLESIEVEGVFMCLQLANIQELNNCFQDKSSSYINKILQTFHETAIQNGGFVFHQDEDYSLVCWKFTQLSGKNTQKNIIGKAQEKKKAELAFLAYLKFTEKLAQQTQNKKMQISTHSYSSVHDPPKIHLGMHSGTAFCGAIGSQFKLSLKAMGTDVSIVRSMCRAAKKYKLENAMSSSYLAIAPFVSSLCRKIEQIQFMQGGRIDNIEIYSSYNNPFLRTLIKIEVQKIHQDPNNQEQDDQFKQRKKIKKIFKCRDELLKNYSKIKIQDLSQICRTFLKKSPNVDQYLDLWRESCNYYEEGQWINAKIGFQNSKDCNVIASDIISDLRIQEIANRDEPPSMWRKQKPFSLFL